MVTRAEAHDSSSLDAGRFFKVAAEVAAYILSSATFIWFAYRQRGRRCARNAREPSFVRSGSKRRGENRLANKATRCKSRVEARDTSLALSRLRSAYAMAIEIDLALPYGRHRRPYHRNYGPDPRRGYPWNSTKRSLPSGHFLRWPDLMVIFFFGGGGGF